MNSGAEVVLFGVYGCCKKMHLIHDLISHCFNIRTVGGLAIWVRASALKYWAL